MKPIDDIDLRLSIKEVLKQRFGEVTRTLELGELAKKHSGFQQSAIEIATKLTDWAKNDPTFYRWASYAGGDHRTIGYSEHFWALPPDEME